MRVLSRLYTAAMTLALTGLLVYGASTTVLAGALGRLDEMFGPRVVLVVALLVVATVWVAEARLLLLWVTPAEATWRDPTHLLRRRGSISLVGGTILVLTLAALAASCASAAGLPPWPFLLVALAVGALGAATAALAQRADRSRWVSVGACLVAVLVEGLLCLRVGRQAGITFGVALIVAAARLIWGSRQARRQRLVLHREVPRWEVVRAGVAMDALISSTVMLDSAPLKLVRDRTSPGSAFRLGSRTLLGTALIRTVTVRRFVGVVLSLPLASAIAPVGGPGPAGTVALITTYLCGVSVSGALDEWADAEALRRTYARRRYAILELAAAALAVVCVFAAVSVTAAGLTWSHVVVAVLTAVLGWFRRLSARDLAGRVGALLATPMGGIPVDLARRLISGPDVVVLAAVLLAVAPASAVALLLAAAVILDVLRRRGRLG